MNLTKFTAHLCERHSWRHCWGAGGRGRRHLENTLCRPGSCPPPGGCDIIKGGNAVLHFSLMRPFFVFCFLIIILFPMHHLSHLHLAECLQLVPDQSPRPARTEGREGAPRSTRFRRPAGRKGARKLITEIRKDVLWKKLEKVILCTSLVGFFFMLLRVFCGHK